MESYGIVIIMQSYGRSTLKVIQPIVWHHLAIVGYASQHKAVHNGSQPGDTMGILYVYYTYIIHGQLTMQGIGGMNPRYKFLTYAVQYRLSHHPQCQWIVKIILGQCQTCFLMLLVWPQ